MTECSYVGIDPGKNGCICILKGQNVELYDWPKDDNPGAFFRELELVFSHHDIKMIGLEQVHAMPKQGVTSMFNFGRNYGLWEGYIISLRIPYLLVSPNLWQRGLISKADGQKPKGRSKVAATRLYPNAELYGSKGGYKDGRGDALLIAHYIKKYCEGERR